MENTIDCLFVGHNEMDFVNFEQEVRNFGSRSGAYRDLSFSFIRYNNRPYTLPDIFNLFNLNTGEPDTGGDSKPLYLGETFSLSIAYLGNYLDKRGLTFDFVNSFQHNREELAEKLRKGNIVTIAIITTLYVSYLPILEIMEFIKKYNSTARVIVGGPFVTGKYRSMDSQSLEYLFKTIDADFYVNSAQGEATLVKLIRTLKNNGSPERVDNIYYKTNGGFAATPIQEESNKLDENQIDWNLFSNGIGEYASMRTSISCPFSCAFCGFPQHAGKYQTVNVDLVEKELDQLARIDSLKSLHIIDDTLNVPVKRFKSILKTMIRKKYPFKWNSHFRCQFADRETVELMKESGCEGVFLGIESGSDYILKNMNKTATVEQYLKGIELLREYDILTFGSFIIGFPGETEETVAETVNFIKEGGLEFFRTQLWYCDPITPIWEKRDQYAISGSSYEWSHRTMDSRRAADIVEEIFLSIDNPIWVPQYNFECDGLFHLIHRGFSMEQIKDMLTTFNMGVKEQLTRPLKTDISLKIAEQLKRSCRLSEPLEEVFSHQHSKIDRAGVSFDF